MMLDICTQKEQMSTRPFFISSSFQAYDLPDRPFQKFRRSVKFVLFKYVGGVYMSLKRACFQR